MSSLKIPSNKTDEYLPAVIVVVIILQMLQVTAQAQVEQKGGPDTVVILKGKLKLVLPTSIHKQIKKRVLLRQYSSEFKINEVQLAHGFDFGKNTTYRFFYTKIDHPEVNDGGFATWKLIESFTDKIPNSRWIKSGLVKTSNGYLYFVNLTYPDKGKLQFSKFIFFPMDGKLAFGLFQCPEDELSKWESYCDADWKPMISNPGRSRLTIF